ncbi:hypothetical protein SAMN04489740_2399 [Arthrobacter alpinus]|uniref:Uncharacterized protein n=2 Tax=Arthrobacter alpinus TaxID=656366 RepID=A0A1H5LDM7_9MICC|nr:hypothetical protein SAMN04489740_2399 [Arthrobacter alpinus]
MGKSLGVALCSLWPCQSKEHQGPIMRAVIFPTVNNDNHLYGLASYLWIDNHLYPTVHNRQDTYALPAYEIDGAWVYPSKYNLALSPQYPVYMLDHGYFVATGHGAEPTGVPIFQVRCSCLPHLDD